MSIVDFLNRNARRVPAGSLYFIGMIPLIWLIFQSFTGGLGIDPVKALEHRLGEIGLQILLATLAISPIRKYVGVNLIKFRRALGLLTFFYVTLHLSVWLLLDIQLLWGQIWADILKRPYITIGMAAYVMMLPLAITSNNRSVSSMGAPAWRQLHRLTYPAALAGALHFVMVVKGWQIEPFIYLGIALALLLLRVKSKRSNITA